MSVEAKRARKQARHDRKVSRREAMKTAGAAAVGLLASLFIPRMVHAEPIRPRFSQHPTWDRLLEHAGAKTYPRLDEPFGPAKDGRLLLRKWVHGLALRPNEPQRALLLTGPDVAGKVVFHHAMALLHPGPCYLLLFLAGRETPGSLDANAVRVVGTLGMVRDSIGRSPACRESDSTGCQPLIAGEFLARRPARR